MKDSVFYWVCGVWFMGIFGVLIVILVVVVVYVVISDEYKMYFDEFVSIGGVICLVCSVNFVFNEELVEICCSKECKKVVKYINVFMDYFKDFCVDFFDYVCGGWIKVNFIFCSLFIYFMFVKLNGCVECNIRYILEKGIIFVSKKLF